MQLDYEKLGFKAGLECHQQLDTGKLFCDCPSILSKGEKPDYLIQRKLRLSASELGEFDVAAVEQFKKNYSFEYHSFDKNCCLIELDEEPPKKVNEKALETVLQVALLTHSLIFDSCQVMRKMVLDGSNTTGFQRTAMIACNGWLQINDKKTISIQSLMLEEDACRIIEKKENQKKIVYALDRLGIPLIELATSPELFSPNEVKEAALKIGELFRITCKAKRGLGSIRQDLNISIAEGARVEIKGIQDLHLIDEFAKREVERQLNLIKIKKELNENNLSEINFEVIELSELFKESKSNLFKGKSVYGINLKQFKGYFARILQGKRTLGKEIADYVKARSGLKGLIHSDENLFNYKLSEKEINLVREKLKLNENDLFVLIIALKETALKAFEVIKQRIIQLFNGVPEETRNPLDDGNSEYSRPLPGPARMYPETDIKLIEILKSKLNELNKSLPLWADQRIINYVKLGLSEQLARKMSLSNFACFFESLLEKGFDVNLSAWLLLEGFTQLKRDGIKIENLSQEMIIQLLNAVKSNEITKDVLLEVIVAWTKTPEKSLSEIIKEEVGERLSQEEIEEIIQKIIEEKKELIKSQGTHAFSPLMGLAMKELKGKASGKIISRILNKKLKELI